MALSTLFNDTEPIPPMVSAFTRGWGFVDEGVAGSPPNSQVWGTANRALFFPIYIPTPTIVTRLWLANGDAAVGNWEVALYRDTGAASPGALLVASGSTAQSGVTSIQFAEITDTFLDVGLVWIYVAADSATATSMRAGPASVYDETFSFMQSSVTVGTPPNPAVPEEMTAFRLDLVGFSTNSVT